MMKSVFKNITLLLSLLETWLTFLTFGVGFLAATYSAQANFFLGVVGGLICFGFAGFLYFRLLNKVRNLVAPAAPISVRQLFEIWLRHAFKVLLLTIPFLVLSYVSTSKFTAPARFSDDPTLIVLNILIKIVFSTFGFAGVLASGTSVRSLTKSLQIFKLYYKRFLNPILIYFTLLLFSNLIGDAITPPGSKVPLPYDLATGFLSSVFNLALILTLARSISADSPTNTTHADSI